MIFLATGGKRKLDPTGSATGRTDEDRSSEDGGIRKKIKQPKKQFPPSPPWNPKGTKGDGKGKGKDKSKALPGVGERDANGRFGLDRNGKEICYGFHNGACKGVCPRGRSHVCQLCLGNHPMTDCKTKGGRNM